MKVFQAVEDTLWYEGFESGFNGWTTDAPTIWQIGQPVIEPTSAYSGIYSAGTVIDANVLPRSDTRLISPPFTVPSDNPRLRFWHWFDMGWNSTFGSDQGYIQISVDGGSWTTIFCCYSNNSGGWIEESQVSLSAYSDSLVRIAFFFVSTSASANGAGWYIDDIFVETDIITSVETEEGGPNLPVEYSLDQNYPNPFNPSTSIKFAIPKAGYVSLIVFNILGQKVVNLIDGDLEAEEYTIQWDNRNSNGQPVASGVYFYRLTADQFIKTKKMMLLK